jgi:hypothetical protein
VLIIEKKDLISQTNKTNFMRKIVALVMLVGIPTIYIAQGFYSRNNWKKRRHEFAIGGGISNSLTDLGGGKGTGRDLTPLDLDLQATKWGFTFEYQYAIARRWTTRTNFIYGNVEADDNYTTSYRTLRGNHFSSDIIELSQVFIYHFRKERIGHLYSLRNARGKKLGITPLNMGWYVFGGIGGFRFDPVSDIRNANDWGLSGTHRLQPLGTEGQFLPGSGREPYSLYSVNIPMGIGMRHSINGDVGLKLEFGYRFTFTDYLDDTSTDFPGWRALEANGSDLAAYYTQPTRTSQSIDYVAYSDNIRGNNGFGERDGYMFLMLTFYFNRDPRHWFDDARRSAVKVRKPRASF